MLVEKGKMAHDLQLDRSIASEVRFSFNLTDFRTPLAADKADGLFCFSRDTDRYSVSSRISASWSISAIGTLNRTVGDGRDGEPHPMVTNFKILELAGL